LNESDISPFLLFIINIELNKIIIICKNKNRSLFPLRKSYEKMKICEKKISRSKLVLLLVYLVVILCYINYLKYNEE
jgi:hypothetical protein